MLCDDLIALPDSAKNMPRVLTDMMRGFADRVASAHRFTLTRDAVLMVQSASESSAKQFLSVLNICRLPYPRMWVEFAFADRELWFEKMAQRGLHPVESADWSPPHKLGFLIEQAPDDERMIVCTPGWSHSGKEPSICNLSIQIDTDPDRDPEPPQELVESFKSSAASPDRWYRHHGDPISGAKLAMRLTPVIPEWQRAMWAEILGRSSQAADRLREMAEYDLRSEWRFVISLLAVLNSKNLFSMSEPTDLTKINAARTKRGKKPLLVHREIRLNLSRVQQNRIRGVGTARVGSVEPQDVRGHFKVRRTGVFWWSDHSRYGSPSSPKSYVVTA